MRNLHIVRKLVLEDSLPQSSLVICTGDNSCLYFIDKTQNTLKKVSIEGESKIDEVLCNSELFNSVFKGQFISSTGSLYFATDDGAFLQYSMFGDVQDLFQCEQGITNFEISPDSRFVTIITRESNLLLMSLSDLELLKQVDLLNTEVGSGDTDKSVEISWRHDSHFFAVNFYNSKLGFRQIKTFDENGLEVATTEECNPLAGKIVSWQPSGGLITSIAQAFKSTVISLFELNCLKRADFNVYEDKDGKEDRISDILWNSTSDVLAVVMDKYVELWTRNNYVWMRKRVIVDFDEDDVGLEYVGWDIELPMRLHLTSKTGKYIAYDFTCDYDVSQTGGSSLACSINGNNVYCTPFRDNCTPPPQCCYQMHLDSQIVEVIQSSFWDGFLCLLSSGKLVFVKNTNSSLKIVKVLVCPDYKERFKTAYNWIWKDATTLCCIQDHRIHFFIMSSEANDEITEGTFILGNAHSSFLKAISLQPVNERPVLCQLSSGEYYTIREVSNEVHALHFLPVCKFPVVCSQFQHICIDPNEILVFGMDPMSRQLYLGWSKYPYKPCYRVSKDCTSLCVFEGSLLFTTIQGSLEILPKEILQSILQQHFENSSSTLDEQVVVGYSRKVEKGSVILTCCFNRMMEPSLVLQILPRGNLETIYPRVLVMSTIKVLLRATESQQNYNEIMSAMRRHRIDYNLLIDEMRVVEKEYPALTLEKSLELMINQAKDTHSLVVLVTEMKEENLDCVKMMKTILEKDGKEEKEKKELGREQAYLAVMAKLNLFEEVLNSHLISVAEDEREVVKSRIKFLSFYCDNPEILYEAALGTYDLTLTSVVADCLNRDPKEYLPILNELKGLPVEKRNYTIDNKLRRYFTAVKSIIQDISIQHNEIVRYVERHRLFSSTLEFLKNPPDSVINNRSQDDRISLRKQIQDCFGQYLEERGKLREASIMFGRSENWNKAIETSGKSGSWETALEYIWKSSETSIDDKQFHGMCLKLLQSLESHEDFESAAKLCQMYMKDYKLAVGYWIQARKWSMAKTLCLNESATLGNIAVEQLINLQLLEFSSTLTDNLNSMMKDMIHYSTRLKIVKENKERQLQEGGGDFPDTFSDTDSISTTSSVKSSCTGVTTSSNFSGRTSRKNARKAQKKVLSLKEGSRFEDLAITIHMWDLYNQIMNNLKPDVSSTVESLWNFTFDKNASLLSTLFDSLLAKGDEIMKEIWSDVLPENPHFESKYRLPPPNWSTTWDKIAL